MVREDQLKKLLATLKSAMEHVREVQTDVRDLNHKAMTHLNDVIFDAGIELSDEVFVALQHQDILTQQLNATSELLDMIVKYVDDTPLDSLDENIVDAVKRAKVQKEAFSGNAFKEQYEQVV